MKPSNNRWSNYFSRYFTRLGRSRLRRYLLTQSDRLLADAGFSRELLDEGVSAWPWRHDVATQTLVLATHAKQTDADFVTAPVSASASLVLAAEQQANRPAAVGSTQMAEPVDHKSAA